MKLDELSTDFNPDITQGQDVTGAAYADNNGYKPTTAVPYQCRKGDAIYEPIQKIADGLLTGDDETKFKMMVATLDKEVKDGNASGKGYQVDVMVVVTSDGGGTSGYTINFTCYENGTREQGTVTVADKVPTFAKGSGIS